MSILFFINLLATSICFIIKNILHAKLMALSSDHIDIYKNFVFVQIIWMNPKRIVISERESRYIDDPRMSIERPFVGDYNLHIRNVRYDDRGEYTVYLHDQVYSTNLDDYGVNYH
jgi:hypothetical protein